MAEDFEVVAQNSAALFTLKLHRGEGMVLLAMNWKEGKPPRDFVGFAIEYMEPGGDRFFCVKNRVSFPGAASGKASHSLASRLSPIQKFRWVHFPRQAHLDGQFVYKVTPVFMNDAGELSYGESQRAAIRLHRETYPGLLNVAFTRGFVSSQAFVDRYGKDAVRKLLPAKADDGLNFVPTHAQAEEALAWMGFEARSAMIAALDEAIADPSAQVRVVAYDLNEPGIVSRLQRLKTRLKIIIDNEGAHGASNSAETQAEQRLVASAGRQSVKRQHMGQLQHNKMVVVDGAQAKLAICGSTNHSWRGFFVQNNNAIVLRGPGAVSACLAAFEAYWAIPDDSTKSFCSAACSTWQDLNLDGIDARISFSPRSRQNAALAAIAQDMTSATSSLFFSLAFLYQTSGAVRQAVQQLKKENRIFSYGISDHQVDGVEGHADGVDLQKPDGKVAVVHAAALTGKRVPEPFKSEPTGGGGTRMHHKFVVIDFDKPTARVYAGSYNFSPTADTSNGENLLLMRDRRIAVAYTVEALRIFDHYHFRVAQMEAKQGLRKLELVPPPRKKGDKAWWESHYTDPRKVRDRELFA